jgi:hypothetical protein
LLIIIGCLYYSELQSEELDEQDNNEEDASMELEYQRLVATSGEAEPLWVETFGGALCTANNFCPQRNRRLSAKALHNLENI